MASNLPLIPQFIENFIQSWSDKRQPVASSHIDINRHRLYILPTRHGVTYFVVLLLILFAAINYEISLGFMLAFLLGSLGFLGMIYTHQNINQLKLQIGQAESVYVGQDILYPITISQVSLNSRANIKLLSETGQVINTYLINESSTECKLPITAKYRGYIKPHRIKLFSEYPLGLFHAWSWLNLDAQCLVYPAPDPHHYPLISSEENSTGQSISNRQGVDDFSGIRQYQVGDQLNHMAWKAIAKTGELQTKLFNIESSHEILISWSQTDETLDIEQRLSILSRMVLDASEKNLHFSLQIPGCTIPSASGRQHKHRCLKSLALFGHPKELLQ